MSNTIGLQLQLQIRIWNSILGGRGHCQATIVRSTVRHCNLLIELLQRHHTANTSGIKLIRVRLQNTTEVTYNMLLKNIISVCKYVSVIAIVSSSWICYHHKLIAVCLQLIFTSFHVHFHVWTLTSSTRSLLTYLLTYLLMSWMDPLCSFYTIEAPSPPIDNIWAMMFVWR